MKKSFLLYASAFAFLLFTYQNANAQCKSPGNGTNGQVHCMFSDSIQNCLYIGGVFQHSGNDTINHCAYWNDSNFLPMKMMGINGCNNTVYCFTRFNGNLYVGGSFTQAGGVACNHIARWDGTSWFAVGEGFNQTVRSLSVYNNELYAGGEFTASGANQINYIAKWNGSQWNQLAGGTNNTVETMCNWKNALYIGGDFTLAGGITVNRICKWDGVSFSAVGGGFTMGMMGQCRVNSLCVYNGNLYAGGKFEHSGAMEMHNMSKWNGTSWSSIGNIEGSDDNLVNAMCSYNGMLYIGGNFASCGSSTANNLGVWNGISWSIMGTGMNGPVNAFSIYHNELYIAGSFSNAAGTPVNNIAKYSITTGIKAVNVTSNLVSLYPNPANDYIQFSWVNENTSSASIMIFDITGRIVMQRRLGEYPAGLNIDNVQLNLNNEGLYFLSLKTGANNFISKFEIKK